MISKNISDRILKCLFWYMYQSMCCLCSVSEGLCFCSVRCPVIPDGREDWWSVCPTANTASAATRAPSPRRLKSATCRNVHHGRLASGHRYTMLIAETIYLLTMSAMFIAGPLLAMDNFCELEKACWWNEISRTTSFKKKQKKKTLTKYAKFSFSVTF